MHRAFLALTILALCALAGAARLWNVRDVFVDGRLYFLDADCYSRMTRARAVVERGTWVIRHHDFENWPEGTRPHTTAPMDWLIVGTKVMLDAGFRLLDHGGTSILHDQTLDLAGALISPLLGLATCAFLGMRAWRRTSAAWLAPLLFFAVSPILVHGTLLGRPDHQSLLILLLTIALTAELELAEARAWRWAALAGAAWALALWVSLYEPLVLLAITSSVWLLLDRQRFVAREMRAGWAVFGVILALAWLVDGWRIPWPDPSLRAAFAVWKATVGELAHLDPRAPVLYRWLGFGILLAPVALGVRAFLHRARHTAPLLALALLLAAFGLTVWQMRWGYFLAVIFAVSLPWQITMVKRAWIVWPGFLFALWPIAADWDEKLFPDDHPELALEKQRAVLRLEAVRLREVAARMRGPARQPFLAPWWLSPALAYWSGQPGVAGSSHESLPGIVASAGFFLAPDATQAEHIARDLGVKWIVTDDPERLVATSRALANGGGENDETFIARLHRIAEPRERVSEADLRAASPEARAKLIELADRAEAAQLGTAAFSCVSSNQFYKLFAVKYPTP